jgi:hypothetical protein
MNLFRKFIAHFLFWFFIFEGTASAGLCPLCRRALEQSGNPGLLMGFVWSVILIAGIPLLIMIYLGRELWLAEKKRQGKS